MPAEDVHLRVDGHDIVIRRSDVRDAIAKARNAGLKLLLPEAEFVTFLDSDDISPQGRLATDLAYFKADPSLDLVLTSRGDCSGEISLGRATFTYRQVSGTTIVRLQALMS